MSDGHTDFRKAMAFYLAIVQRAVGHWKWGVALCLVISIAGTVFAATRRKYFTSSTRVRVVAAQVDRMAELMGSESTAMRDLEARLNQFVGSRRFLQEVVDEYGLFREEKRRMDLTDGEVLKLMRKKLDFGVYQGDEFGFAYTDFDPRRAQQVTKSLADRFMEREKGADYAVYRTKLSHVESQLERVEQQLNEMLDREARFKELNANLVKRLRRQQFGGNDSDRLALPTNGSAETKETSRDSPQLRLMRRRLKTLEETAQRVRARSRSAAGGAIGNERASVNDQVVSATRDYERLRQQYTEEWPDVRVAKQRLDRLRIRQRELEAMFREQQANQSRSGELATVTVEITALRGKIRQWERREKAGSSAAVADESPEEEPTKGNEVAQVDESPAGRSDEVVKVATVEELDAALRRMETEMRPVREQVQALHSDRLMLQFQTRQREQGGMQYMVIDPANLPVKASGPPRSLMAVGAGMAGLLLGLACMLTLGFLDSRVYRPIDLARFEQVPLLVVIPDFEGEIQELDTGDPGGRVNEESRSISPL